MRARHLIGLGTVLVAQAARAEGALAITTVEHGAWGATIASLEADLRSEGKSVQVRVSDGARALPCGTYALNLDDAGSRAFHVGTCNPSTGATLLTLTSRAQLFDHEGGGSTPRSINIVATRVESASTSGGAVVKPESAVSCSAEVTPYMPNLENGTRTALKPGRYELLARAPDAHVSKDDTHWTLSRSGAGPIPYDVIDLQSGKVILSDRVEVICGSSGSDAAPVVAQQKSDPVIVLKPELGVERAESPPAAQETAWQGHAISVDFVPGVAVLTPQSLTFRSPEWGALQGQDLGLATGGAPTLGLRVMYERPWFYGSIGGNVAFADAGQGRTLFEMGAAASAGLSLHFGSFSVHGGPNLALSSYQLTAQGGGRFEWGSNAEWGFGVETGVRAHLGGAGPLAVLGLDVVAPIAGHQPWFIVASIGFGAGK